MEGISSTKPAPPRRSFSRTDGVRDRADGVRDRDLFSARISDRDRRARAGVLDLIVVMEEISVYCQACAHTIWHLAGMQAMDPDRHYMVRAGFGCDLAVACHHFPHCVRQMFPENTFVRDGPEVPRMI